MQDITVNPLRGKWTKGKKIKQIDNHTRLDRSYDGFLSTNFVDAIVSYAISYDNENRIQFGVTRVGMHSLYLLQVGSAILWDEYRWSLEKRANMFSGKRGKVVHVGAGETYEFDGRNLTSRGLLPKDSVTTRDITLQEAIGELETTITEVAEELVETAGNPKVICMLSAGTDSTMGLVALVNAGIDVHAVCVGRSEEDFDPKHARKYAEQLGVPYTFIQIPETDDELKKLVTRAITVTEQCEMSNTLMAICTTLVRDFAVANNRPLIVHGHYADDLLGFSSITFGQFKKSGDTSDQAWSDYRCNMYQHIIPNDTQVSKVSRVDGCTWRSIYYHPKVRRLVWAMPKSIVPVHSEKPLFGGVCDRHIDNAAWHEKKKVGYYTGSGIGKIRLENPILQDKHLRNVHKLVKANKTR